MGRPDEPHVCWDCRTQIGDREPHIHAPMDAVGAELGLPGLGLDDLFTLPFCEPCTVRSARRRYELEAHPIGGDAP